jgi:putative ABC transport system substrate-binding protein
VQVAAGALGRRLTVVTATAESEIEPAFLKILQLQAGGLIVAADPFLNSRREQLVALAARNRIAAIYEWREFVQAGGLMSYGSSLPGAWQQVGVYAGRILKGEKPRDLPVQQPTKIELAVNLKVAKAGRLRAGFRDERVHLRIPIASWFAPLRAALVVPVVPVLPLY